MCAGCQCQRRVSRQRVAQLVCEHERAARRGGQKLASGERVVGEKRVSV